MAYPKDINFLLLGESGVGKSTFINSCYNYFIHPTFERALTNEVNVIIPAKFEITDKHFNQKTVQLGHVTDGNECFDDAFVATQNVRLYNFPIEMDGKKYRLRFLDTPGMGDPRGLDQDKLNCERILNFASVLSEIHGFCLLLKPNCSKLDLLFEYCLTQILSRLELSAVDNIFFIFTESRGENYTPGRTLPILKKFIQNLKKNHHMIIPLSKENIFCFDNEGLRYVGAIQKGVELDDDIFLPTKTSWKKSSNELWRMIDYAIETKPHDLQKTMLINESKMIASLLSKPLCKILGVIQGNLQNMEVTTKELNDANLTLDKLKKEMRKPRTELRITKTDKRQIVCHHRKCIGFHEVNGIQETYHKKCCCSNCENSMIMCEIFVLPLTTVLMKSFGIPSKSPFVPLINLLCNIFSQPPCGQCQHPFHLHEEIFYITELVTKEIDESLLPVVNDQANVTKAKQDFLEKLQIEITEYEEERHKILETCINLERFLKANSIAPMSDPTENYFNYLKITCDSNKTRERIKEIITEYSKMKNHLNNVGVANEAICFDKIKKIKTELFDMKHFGRTIEKMFVLHDGEIKKDIKHMEVQVMTQYVKREPT